VAKAAYLAGSGGTAKAVPFHKAGDRSGEPLRHPRASAILCASVTPHPFQKQNLGWILFCFRSLASHVSESEAVTKLVPSAKADSPFPTFASRHCRAGLSHVAASRQGFSTVAMFHRVS